MTRKKSVASNIAEVEETVVTNKVIEDTNDLAPIVANDDIQLTEGSEIIGDKPDVVLGELVEGTGEAQEVIPVAVTDEDLAAGNAVANNEFVHEGLVGKHVDASPMGEYCKSIDAYADKMGPANMVTPIIIATAQMELYQAVTGIVNNFEGSKFVTAYTQALAIMHAKAPAFADNLLFRGVDTMRVPPQVRQRYENILILMSSTANPKNRASALKSIDMNVLCEGFTSDVEQKIKGFYSQFLG
jgi:hypothetical protein